MDLSNFRSEVDRGCIYVVTAKISHKAGLLGMLTGPYFLRNRGYYFEGIIPVCALKPEALIVNKGDTGELANPEIAKENFTYRIFGIPKGFPISYIIQWEKGIEVRYQNPIRLEDYPAASITPCRFVTLEEMFSIRKKEPRGSS